MSTLGSERLHWIDTQQDIRYVVLDVGTIRDNQSGVKAYRFTKGDIITVTGKGEVSVESASLRTTVTGGRVTDVANLASFNFTLNSMSWTINLDSPVIKNNLVIGAMNVRSIPAAASGSSLVQEGVQIARLM